MKIRGHELASLSFPDFAVVSSLIDAVRRSILITTNGAFLDDGNGQSFSRVSLSFSDWDSLSVRCYDAQTESWECCNYDELKDICEFEMSPETVTFRGFGRNEGHWMEVRIIGGIATAKLD